jgi:hypothetical protein
MNQTSLLTPEVQDRNDNHPRDRGIASARLHPAPNFLFYPFLMKLEIPRSDEF